MELPEESRHKDKNVSEKIRIRVEDLLRRRENLFNNKDLKTKNEIYHIIVTFCKNIRKQYGEIDCQKYPFYRVIAFGTPPDDYLENFIEIDFPGDDSIEKLIERLEKEYK